MGKASRKDLFRRPIFHLFLIALVGFLAYSNTFHVPFQFDDGPSIIENPIIKNLFFFMEPSKAKVFNSNIFEYSTFRLRYIGYFSFALNYKIHGLGVTGFHIFNLTIHILNAILVYWFMTLTLRIQDTGYTIHDKKHASCIVHHESGQADSPIHPFTYLPLFIALLFVSHPIQTQAVTYIWQRVASLATFFYLLSLVMYIKFRIHDTKKMHDAGYTIHDKENHTSCIMNRESCIVSHASCILYLVSLFSAVLAMKTKEIAFTLPIIITLYEFMFFNDSRFTVHGSRFKRILYLFPLLLTMLIIPLSLIGIDKPVGELISDVNEATKTTTVSVQNYLFTQFRVIVTYIRLLFFPINQNLDYDYPVYNSVLEPQVVLSFLFLLSIFGLGVYLFYRSRCTIHDSRFTIHDTRITHHVSRLIAFGIFWFFITLSVESSIIPISPYLVSSDKTLFFGIDVIYEHRVYMLSLGAFIALAASTITAVHRLKIRWPLIGTAIIPAIALITITLTCASYSRNTVWKNEISLWEDVIKKSQGKARGHNNLGAYYKSIGRYDSAIEHLQIALKLNPDYPDAHTNLGAVYQSKGLIDNAIEECQIALKLRPDFKEAYYNLGFAYASKGLLDKAIEQYQIALKLKPDFADCHNNLGNVYKSAGLIDKAIEQYRSALSLKPDHANAHYNLAAAYSVKGSSEKAIEQYLAVLNLNPDDAEVHYSLGKIYREKGLIDDAIKHYRTALKLKPDYVESHKNLAHLLLLNGSPDEAIEHYQAILNLKQQDAEIYSNLGSAYYSKGLIDKAIEYYQAALKLKPDFAEVNNNLGSAYGTKGLTDKAIGHFQIAVKLKPEYIDAHNNLGNAYMGKGFREKAQEHFNIVKELKSIRK